MSRTIKSLSPQLQQGFALLEVALAVMIAASVFLATIEFLQISSHRASAERMGQDINEIFNAGISYYLANSSWPDSIESLVDNAYLPKSALKNPWGYEYKVAQSGSSTGSTTWTIGTCLPSSVAVNLAALLPFGTIADSDSDNCAITSSNLKYVTTTINQAVGGQQSLSVTMVTSGSKVAAPSCPIVNNQTYTPHIFLLPAAFDSNGHVISAMSAYADTLSNDDPTNYPNGYWTVHLDLTTDQGTSEDKESDDDEGPEPAVMAAFTNCTPPNTSE